MRRLRVQIDVAGQGFSVWVFGVAALLSLLIIAMGFATVRAFYLDKVRCARSGGRAAACHPAFCLLHPLTPECFPFHTFAPSYCSLWHPFFV
jgi:hypothetical protein